MKSGTEPALRGLTAATVPDRPDPVEPPALRPLGLVAIGDPCGTLPGTPPAQSAPSSASSPPGIGSPAATRVRRPGDIDRARVFARIQPELNLDIIAELQLTRWPGTFGPDRTGADGGT